MAYSQLGHTGHQNISRRRISHGESSAPIWMDDVNCSYSNALKSKV